MIQACRHRHVGARAGRMDPRSVVHRQRRHVGGRRLLRRQHLETAAARHGSPSRTSSTKVPSSGPTAVREQCVVQLLLFISATSGEWRGGGTALHGSGSPHSASLAAKLGTDPPQGPSWATRPPGAAPRPGRCHAAPIVRGLHDRRCKSRIGAAIRQHRSLESLILLTPSQPVS